MGLITELIDQLDIRDQRIDKERGFETLIFNDHCQTVKFKDNEYATYLSYTIGCQGNYTDFMIFLRQLKKGSKIRLYINNFGGEIHTLAQLINCIRDTKADVTGVCDSAVYSAAPVLLLSCPEIILKPNSMLMFHDYASWSGGKGHEQRAQAENITIHLSNIMKTNCCPFLSEKEIDKILDGKDTYIHYEEATKRLKKHNKG